MKIISFEANGRGHWGALHGDNAVDLNLSHALYLASRSREPQYIANSALEFVQKGESAWNAARETLEFLGDRFVEGAMFPLERTRLLAPISRPPKIVAIGHNYLAHVKEQNAEIPLFPILFGKYSSSVTGPYDVIHLHPGETQKVDFEGELGVLIGKTASRVSAVEALDYVFGYTIIDDVSARDLQNSPHVRGQWVRGKSLDTYCPYGPCLVTRDEIPDPQALALQTRLNGEVMQDLDTGHMIFSVARLIEFVSQAITLEPGDLLATGTPPGVGHHRKPPVYLKPGDVVEVEIQGLGMIRNEVLD